MGKIEAVMKKQVRATCVPLAREVRQLRRTVSDLRGTIKAFKNIAAEYQTQRLAEKARLNASPDELVSARLSARLIKALRRHLGLTQGELAALVGVSIAAVGFWEQGKARPHGHNKEAIVALRKLGKREVRRILSLKTASLRQKPTRRGRRRKTRRRRR